MANIKSSIKSAKKEKILRQLNKAYISSMRTEIKKFDSLLEEKNKEKASIFFKNLTSVIDKTAAKGLIKKQKASRYKRKFNQKLKALILS